MKLLPKARNLFRLQGVELPRPADAFTEYGGDEALHLFNMASHLSLPC